MGVSNASFRTGALHRDGTARASVEAVLCTDAIQFPASPKRPMYEIRTGPQARWPGGADLLGAAGPAQG